MKNPHSVGNMMTVSLADGVKPLSKEHMFRIGK